jgi:hypothetical protein
MMYRREDSESRRFWRRADAAGSALAVVGFRHWAAMCKSNRDNNLELRLGMRGRAMTRKGNENKGHRALDTSRRVAELLMVV